MHDATRHEIETDRAMSIKLGLLVDRDVGKAHLTSQPATGVLNGSGNWFQVIA